MIYRSKIDNKDIVNKWLLVGNITSTEFEEMEKESISLSKCYVNISSMRQAKGLLFAIKEPTRIRLDVTQRIKSVPVFGGIASALAIFLSIYVFRRNIF